jgi:hypothetical protein
MPGNLGFATFPGFCLVHLLQHGPSSRGQYTPENRCVYGIPLVSRHLKGAGGAKDHTK